MYEGFIRQAIEHAILPNAAWYCWHASRRQAMVESVWETFGAFVHQQLMWAKDRGILTRSYYLWQHEPCFFGWLKGPQAAPGVGRLPEHGVEPADGEGRREIRAPDVEADRGVRHPDAPACPAGRGLQCAL